MIVARSHLVLLLNIEVIPILLMNVDMIIIIKNHGVPQALVQMAKLTIGRFVTWKMVNIPLII